MCLYCLISYELSLPRIKDDVVWPKSRLPAIRPQDGGAILSLGPRPPIPHPIFVNLKHILTGIRPPMESTSYSIEVMAMTLLYSFDQTAYYCMALIIFASPSCTSYFRSKTSESRSFIYRFLSSHSSLNVLLHIFFLIQTGTVTYNDLFDIHSNIIMYKVKITMSKSSVYKCILGANVGYKYRLLNPNKPATMLKIKQKHIVLNSFQTFQIVLNSTFYATSFLF